MQNKLSKTFIYSWLLEDAYGEFTLYKNTTRFTDKLLSRIWQFFQIRNNIQRGSLINNGYLPFYTNYISLHLRRRFTVIKQSLFRSKKLFLFNLSLYTNFIYYSRNIKNNFLLSNYDIITKKFPIERRIRHNMGVVGKIKFVQLKCLRFRKPHLKPHVVRRNINLLRFKKFKKKLLYDQLLIKKTNVFKTPARRLIKNRGRISQNHWASTPQWKKYSYKKFKHLTNKHLNFNNWYMVITTSKLKIKRGLGINSLKSYWRHISPKPAVFSKFSTNYFLPFLRTLHQVSIIRRNWSFLPYKLRRKTNWYLGKRRKLTQVKNTHNLRFTFSDRYVKKNILVKKSELRPLLRFRKLVYFNIAENPIEAESVLKSLTRQSKMLLLTSAELLEYQINSSILRSNFFENGYIVNSLLKRGVFLLNGSICFSRSLVQPWDLITVKKPVWWSVYARFINFFSVLLNKNIAKCFALRNRHLVINGISANFLKNLFMFRRLFRRRHLSRYSNLGSGTQLIRLKNFIFALPPAYMEVSYKLLIILVYRFITKAADYTTFFNLRGLKNV